MTTTITEPLAQHQPLGSPWLTGVNHVALVTANLDRFVDFYRRVFDASVIPFPGEADFRHAMVMVGDQTGLHPFEVAGNPNGAALPRMFARGHLDHVALNAASEAAFFELRRRLVAAAACDGAITDFGPVLSVWFEDPDGMGAEVCWTRDRALRGVHGPRPYRPDDDNLG